MQRPVLRTLVLLLLGTAVFAICYCQAPLYYSNQNQYFLHGLALAGDGLLREDWLANTLDPTPIFSGLVAFTARFLHPAVFYVEYALLMGVYAAALFGLFVLVAGPATAARRWPLFVALLLLFHAALPRWVSYRLLGQDYPWYFQAGLAGQYLLGPVLQPSVFGVLLVAALTLFLRGRPYLAGACIALGATVHTTYLLPGALLTLGFLYALMREGQFRAAVRLGAWTLVLVLPIVIHTLVVFGPTSPATFHEAQNILVNKRIPHHTQPRLWCDAIAIAQLAWFVAGVFLAPAGRIRVVLVVSAVLAALLTAAQVTTDNATLALLFPWRVSVILIPVATVVILARLASLPRLDGRLAWGAAALVVLVLAAGGAWIMATHQAFAVSDDELRMLDFVRQRHQPGDVYLIPVTVPPLAKTTHGAFSSDFKPMAEKRQDAAVIPYDLQRFRLSSGTPIYVDFKAVPYKDEEVLEWNYRLGVNQDLQRRLHESDGGITQLRRHGITHVVVPAGEALKSEGLEEVYQDSHYRVYRVVPP